MVCWTRISDAITLPIGDSQVSINAVLVQVISDVRFRDYTGATPATKKSPKLYRIEQHESLTVSTILAFHRWAGWVDGI